MVMSKVTVKIGSYDYPCRLTLGSMLYFKRETGREVGEMAEGSLSDAAVLLYSCVKSASRADGVPFEFTLDDFADRLEPQVAAAAINALMSGGEDSASKGSGKKKA